MCPHPADSRPSKEKTPSYPASEVIQSLLSTLPPIPQSLKTHIHDAHCHPTDHPHTLTQTDPNSSGSLCAMSTRPNDQSLVHKFSADNPEHVIPFYGYHPWYAHLFHVPTEEYTSTSEGHYESILAPLPPKEFISNLSNPLNWDTYLQDLRKRLQENPNAGVGEIGIDKSFRLRSYKDRDGDMGKELSIYRTSQAHQLRIFMDQCNVAAEFGRVISIHGVKCHGLLFNTLQSLFPPSSKAKRNDGKHKNDARHPDDENDINDSNDTEKKKAFPFPPRICIHSASLPPNILTQYLNPSFPLKSTSHLVPP